MCNFKSEVEKYNELMAHYSASFDSITAEMDVIREKFSTIITKDDALKAIGVGNLNQLGAQLMAYNEKDALPATLTKQELTEMRWYQRFLSAYGNPELHQRFYENAFDHFPMPIVTSGEPDKFKFFRWGLVPFFMKSEADANKMRISTVNCISEEMWTKPAFRDAIKNGQRCLIPVTGFYEWRWLDEAGTVKIPYYVTFRDQKVRSIAGLYSRWKNPATQEYYYSYTVLTCPANAIMEYVHNAKKRMPVFIAPEDEKTWLNPGLSKKDVDELCRPYQDPAMRAYTISKLLTTRNVNVNVPEVRAPFNYNKAIHEINEFLAHGEKKRAIEVFKASIAESGKESQMQIAASQEVIFELSMT